MTYFERVDELRDTIILESENAQDVYAATEATLVSLLTEQLKGAEVRNNTYACQFTH